jgi:two-component system sensor histidine kinase UhpB
MSLRVQFLLSVALALAISLMVEATIACRQARQSVANEMRKALEASDRIVDNALLSLPATGTDVYLSHLVRSFDGNRHVRVALTDHGRELFTSAIASPEPVPVWFVKLLEIPPDRRIDSAPLLQGRELVVSSDPHNEISESWDQFRDGTISLALFSLLALGLLLLAMARIQAPLKRLGAGFAAVGGGDYAARVKPGGPREFLRLAEAFNRMAERLDKMQGANARMSRQMLAIQDEERADLARELHDEMGPFLFAMRVDAEAIEASAREVPHSAIAARARAVGEAVTHIQRHVRLLLRQLRPTDFTDFGLVAGIENLAAFWRRHIDDIAIELDIAPAQDGFGADIDATIYRLVQEGLTNAARHGGAKHVRIVIATGSGSLSVTVDDDGAGLRDDPNDTAGLPNNGLGLKGMRERLASLDGKLSLSARPGGGTRLAAKIPYQRLRSAEEVV